MHSDFFKTWEGIQVKAQCAFSKVSKAITNTRYFFFFFLTFIHF